jgi:hypothetical protein
MATNILHMQVESTPPSCASVPVFEYQCASRVDAAARIRIRLRLLHVNIHIRKSTPKCKSKPEYGPKPEFGLDTGMRVVIRIINSHYISSARPPPETPLVRGDLNRPNVLTPSMLTLVSGEGRNLEGGVAPGEFRCLILEGSV